MLKFLFDNAEVIIGGIGGLSVALFMLTRKSSSSDNDMTPRVIKLKRYTDSVSKRSKTAL